MDTATATVTATVTPTAVPIEAKPIVVADPVIPEQRPHNNRNRNRKGGLLSVAISVGALLAVAIALGIVLVRQRSLSNDVSSSSSSSSSSTQPQSSDTDASSMFGGLGSEEAYQQRREDMIALLEPLYDNDNDNDNDNSDPDGGGVQVFDPSTPMASNDRIAALEWIVRDDPAAIKIPDETETEQVDYEEQVFAIRQRYVLALLYMATNGPHWEEQYNFLSFLDVCKWTSVYAQGEVTPTSPDVFVDSEFSVKGAICNGEGKVEKLSIYWNSMSGTIPHELSFFRDTLMEINFTGGSISGTIPPALSKLANLDILNLSDNCMTGEIPEDLNNTPLTIFTVHNNNYGLTAKSGMLGHYCDGNGNHAPNMIAIAADCPPEAFEYYSETPNDPDTNATTSTAIPSPWGCDCCICCYPEEFKCEDIVNGWGWTSHFLDDLSPNGFPKAFDTQCVTSEQESWIAENCPCVINISELPIIQPFKGKCTTDCTEEGARPSYDFGA